MGVLKRWVGRLCRAEWILWTWYQLSHEERFPERDYHLFEAPGLTLGTDAPPAMFFLHTPSGRHFQIGTLLARLIQLVQSPPEVAREQCRALAASEPEVDWLEWFQGYEEFVRNLRATVRPAPGQAEPAPRKGELLMFGNLTCNMKCPYCLSRDARAEAVAGRAPALMPLETAYRSIRFIAERMAGRVENVFINFTLGGEPLLSLERYQHLRDYCAQVSQELGLTVTLNMNTNGTAFSEAFFEYAEKSNVWMAVSIDGPKEIHDSMRPFLSGKGTHDTLVRNLPRVLNSPVPGLNEAAGGAVLTAKNPYPKRVYQHLIELGFKHVVVTPVRDEPGLEWSLNAETVAAFKQGYTEYAEWLLECLVSGDDRVYVALVEHDFFARYLIRVIRETKLSYRCEAGRSTFGVGMDGGLYPCDNFIKLEDFRLGDVFNGLDAEKHAAFLKDTMIDQKPVCKDCWARYQCGGGCYFTSALANGDHRIPHEAKCDLIRHCVELAIWIVAELGRRNPEALQRLAEGVLSAKSLQVTPGINA